MSSILKVDQIQSDSGTINVASNIGTAGNFAITGNLTASGMSSPSGTMNVSSDIATTGNVSINGKATINSDGRQFSVIGAGSTLYEDYKCRAWVNFKGTGTVSIRASGNVSSITDNGTGLYSVNFTTAMPDTNYAVFGHDHYYGMGWSDTQTTTSYKVYRTNNSFGYADVDVIWSAVFR